MNRLPLYALPGMMNDARVWQHVTEAFASQRKVQVADIADHDSIPTLAARALEYGPAGTFALVAFSFGGYVAMEMLRQAPERIAALALLDTSARQDTADAEKMRRRMITAVQTSDTGTSYDALCAAYLPRMVHSTRLADPALVGLLSSMARSAGTAGFVRQQTAALNRVDSCPLLAQIHCPTLVLCGRQDLLTPLECTEELGAGISGARVVVIEDCGHTALLERPAAVVEALAGWLAVADELELRA